MKKWVLLISFIVSWKISGTMMAQCDEKQRDPLVGACVVNLKETPVTRSFDKKSEATEMYKLAKAAAAKKEGPYHVSDVHIYSEEGAK